MDPRQYGPEVWPHADQVKKKIERLLDRTRIDPQRPTRPGRERRRIRSRQERRNG